MNVIEHATVEELGGSLDINMNYYPPNGGKWTVRIARSTPYPGFWIWAEHDLSGAVVPTEATDDGWGPSKDHRTTLAAARDRAERLATLLRGTLEPFDWRRDATREG